MSVSIYFSFSHGADVDVSEDLENVMREWRVGVPSAYEPLSWYRPELENHRFKYAGSLKLSPIIENAWEEIQIAARLLSNLRNAVGGIDWKVSVDDHFLPWDEEECSFNPH